MEVIAEAVRLGFERFEARRVGLLGGRIGAAGGEGHRHALARGLRRLLDADAAAEHDQVGDRDRLAGIALDALIDLRSEEHTSELQSLMRISYAVFCLKKTKKNKKHQTTATK